MTAIWTAALVLGGAVYCGFILTALVGILRHKRNPASNTRLPRVSVIVSARNEEAEIGSTLDSLLAQDYPDFEIIVINDRSTDRTAEIIRANPKVRLIQQTEVPPGWSPKKAALLKGIKASTGEIIVATDADCRHPDGWINALVTALVPVAPTSLSVSSPVAPTSLSVSSPVAPTSLSVSFLPPEFERPTGTSVLPAMVIGQARFDIGPNPPLWQRLQALDFTSQEILSAGLASAGTPFNCSGASIAYSRKSFDQVGGWQGVEGFVSGDDELLMAKFVKAGIPVVAAFSPESVVRTRPPESLRAVWRQRVRWGSKTLHYAWSRKLTLSGIFIFYLALTLTPVVSFMGAPFIAAVVAFFLKLVVDGALLVTGGRLFGDKIAPLDFLIAELLHPPLIVAMAIAGAFGKVRWKD